MASPFTPATIPSSSSSTSIPTDGWTAITDSLAYGTADAPTFTITCAGRDLTSSIGVGMRLKLTQTTVKYFIVTAIAFSTDTTITVYGGTDYTLANAAISLPYYSPVKSPLSFPTDPAKWTVTTSDTGNRSQATPTQNTWYNPNSNTISVPIGCWDISYDVLVQALDATAGDWAVGSTLSTANNSESDSSMTCYQNQYFGANMVWITPAYRRRFLTVAAKTSYYLNISTYSSGLDSMAIRGDVVPTVIRAVSAYL